MSLTKAEIKEMIKTQVEKSVKEIVSKELNSKEYEKMTNELIIKSMTRFYKLLWVRSSTWARDLK